MLKKLLVQLRQQPKHIKDNIALAAAASITAVVAMIWAYQIPNSFQDTISTQQANTSDAFTTFLGEIREETSTLPELASEIESEEMLEPEQEIFSVGAQPAPTTSSALSPREVRIVTTSTAATSATSSEVGE